MRHNQRLTLDQLWDETEKAFTASGKSQAALARELGLSEGAVSKALKKPEPGTHRYAEVQARILSHLTGYQIEREPVEITYRARKAG